MSEVASREDLIYLLKQNGIKQCYLNGDKDIIVRESDPVKVKVAFQGSNSYVQALFPQLGNDVQVVTTIILIIICSYFLGGTLGLLTAIGIGQAIAYMWYKPKANKLKERVEKVLVK